MTGQFWKMTATEIAQGIARGEISTVDVVPGHSEVLSRESLFQSR